SALQDAVNLVVVALADHGYVNGVVIKPVNDPILTHVDAAPRRVSGRGCGILRSRVLEQLENRQRHLLAMLRGQTSEFFYGAGRYLRLASFGRSPWAHAAGLGGPPLIFPDPGSHPPPPPPWPAPPTTHPP